MRGRPVTRASGWSPAGRLLARTAREHRGALGVAGASAVVVAAAEIAAPWPLKWVVDAMVHGRSGPFELTGEDYRLLAGVALATIGIALLNAVGAYAGDLWLRRAGERIAHDLRVRTYEHLHRLSLAYHDRRAKGDLVTRVTEDANRVGEGFSESLGAMAQAALMVVGMLAFSLWLDPVLGLVLAGVVPVLALVTVHYRRRVRAAARRQRAHDGDIASMAAESLSAIRLVQAYGNAHSEQERVRSRSAERQRSGIEVAVLEARFAGMVDVLGAFAVTAVVVLGAFRVAAGAITVGTIVVFAQYARRLYRPLKDIAKHATRISRAMARAEQIAEVLAADEVLVEGPGAHAGPRAAGHVVLDSVSFSHDGRRPAIQGLSVDLPAGGRVAVVGASGAGKSTAGALIARAYDPDDGRVTLDGRDLRDCALRWVRAQVGVLLQDTVLVTGTVADNIAYGTDATRDQVVAAARDADAHDFITALPGGYDHPLGPQGIGLSGGQRQRLGIARVLLRDPPVLLLDEPTTGLDAASEARVTANLERLMAGRTTLVMTHSLVLAGRADRILVLEAGRVIQDGTPAELLALPGLYRRLAREQGLLPAGRHRTERREASPA